MSYDRIIYMSSFRSIDLLNTPVHYINLDSDTEKRDSMEKLLGNAGFKSVHRFSGTSSNVKSLGCAISHNSILKELSGEKEPFLVLEDDIAIHRIKETIRVPLDANAYYLGLSMWGIYDGRGHKKISLGRHSPGTYRLYNMLAAHAILYTDPEYVKFLAKATEFNVYVKTNQDKARAETMKYWNVYASQIPVFYQRGKYEKYTKFALPGPTASGPEGAYTFGRTR
jgi:hypothetical protein